MSEGNGNAPVKCCATGWNPESAGSQHPCGSWMAAFAQKSDEISMGGFRGWTKIRVLPHWLSSNSVLNYLTRVELNCLGEKKRPFSKWRLALKGFNLFQPPCPPRWLYAWEFSFSAGAAACFQNWSQLCICRGWCLRILQSDVDVLSDRAFLNRLWPWAAEIRHIHRVELSFVSYRYIEHVPMCVLNAIIVNGASHLTEFDQAGGVEEQATCTKLHSL